MDDIKKVSVVVCTYNREKFLRDALDSLVHQSLNRDFYEVIIVNNNSTDSTENISKKFMSDHPELDVTYVVESKQGLSFARNRGIEESKYQIITFIDDDAYASRDFLELIYKYFTDHPNVVGVGGKVIPRYEGSEPEWMNPYLYGIVTKIDYGDEEKKFPKNRFPAGCNMTYRKDILVKVGGFNTKLKWRADDKYINFKIKELSDDIYYIPSIMVEHTIDEYRTTDENFIDITTKFGNSERIRVLDEGRFSYASKLIEFMYKLAGSFILMIGYYFKGEFKKGNYTLWYRWIATKAFLFPTEL